LEIAREHAMKRPLFICDQCGARTEQDPDVVEAPFGWATIYYERFHTVFSAGETQMVQTTATTHACADCAEGVLQALEKYEEPQHAVFDGGGAA
jgi:hypothetical protein